VQKTRLKLKKWADSMIVPENTPRLDLIASKLNRPNPCENVALFVDSSDFQTNGTSGCKKGDPRRSYKLNKAGRKWMTISNAKAQTLFISGPWSPKKYDGEILTYEAQKLDALFPNMTMIGDNHFRSATDFLKKITLITNKSAAGRPKIVKKKKVKHKLSEEDERRNSAIAGVHGKIEAPYGWVKRKFCALNGPFGEDEEQHNALIWTAFACHRLSID